MVLDWSMMTSTYGDGGPGGSHPSVGTGRGVPSPDTGAPKVLYIPEIVELSMRVPGGDSPAVSVNQVTVSEPMGDKNRHRLSREEQSSPEPWTPPLSEGDWIPLLCGLGLALVVILAAVGGLHMYLRFVRW